MGPCCAATPPATKASGTTARHGIGIYTWAAGHRYEGGWRDDRPHGFGTATFADGDVHQGEWHQGCYGERDGIWSALIATVEDCGFN